MGDDPEVRLECAGADGHGAAEMDLDGREAECPECGASVRLHDEPHGTMLTCSDRSYGFTYMRASTTGAHECGRCGLVVRLGKR